MNFALNIFSRKAVQARTLVAKAFVKYWKNGGLAQASPLAKARFDPPSEYGLSLEDSGKLEVPLLFAVLSTTVPAAFWSLGHICARPELLSKLRIELSSVMTIAFGGQNNLQSRPEFIVDFERLKTRTPLLFSVDQETLRTQTFYSDTWTVLEDTILDSNYLLKKGYHVLIPSKVIHFSNITWGPAAGEIDHYRFMPSEKDSKTRQAPHTFRSFGDLPNLYPGRHFGSTDVMAILAVMLMRYDIAPDCGWWDMPEKELVVFAATMPPKTDIKVKLTPRLGWQGDWIFKLGNPSARPPLLCG